MGARGKGETNQIIENTCGDGISNEFLRVIKLVFGSAGGGGGG